MSTSLASPIWNACSSALQLDRFNQDELAAEERDALRSHLDGCAGCTRELKTIRIFEAEALPPLRLLSRADKPRNSLRLAASVTAMLATAAAVFVIANPSVVRSKGSRSFALGMYVQHEGNVRRAGPGDVLHPGDSIRFSTSAREAGYAAVLSVDPAGAASIYFPLQPTAARVDAGTDVPLPLSTRLDATVGEEKLFGLWCKTPVELAPVQQSLGKGALSLPAGCQLSQWSFLKR